MASYSADRTLVQGARDVGRSMMPVDTSDLDKIIETGTKLGVASLDEKRKKAQKKVDAWDAFGKDAEQVLLDGGSLGEALYGDTVDFAKQAKEDYLAALKSGDETAQFAAKKALQDRSLFTQSHKATIQEISELRNPKEGELGLSKGHSKEQISTMSDIISGRYTVGKNKDDVMVFKLSNGKEVTNAEFESMAMIEHLATGHELGKQVGDVKNSETFNEAASRDSYSRVIPKTEKEFIASMYDDLGGQGGENNLPNLLRQDFESGNLENEIKSALGQDMYNKFDTDGIPGLSDEEKDNFIDTITNPENENFDLNTSRTIFVEKMVDATRNAHNTHWAEKTRVAEAEAAKSKTGEKSNWQKMSVGERNDHRDARYLLEMSNSNDYSGLTGRKTAAGGTFGGMVAQGRDGKFRLFYNMPSNPDKPTVGDRQNALTLPDAAHKRYAKLASFFGMGGSMIPQYLNQTKNMPSVNDGALTLAGPEYLNQEPDPDITYGDKTKQFFPPTEVPGLKPQGVIDFSKPKE